MILMHYTAIRLAGELSAIAERVPVELGITDAAAGAARALKLLLEICTVRRMDDPRFAHLHANLSRASVELFEAGDRLGALLSETEDAAAVLAATLHGA